MYFKCRRNSFSDVCSAVLRAAFIHMTSKRKKTNLLPNRFYQNTDVRILVEKNFRQSVQYVNESLHRYLVTYIYCKIIRDSRGINGIAHCWFTSFLTNRMQYCYFYGECSSINNFECGIPQGSCLRPILFNLYE